MSEASKIQPSIYCIKFQWKVQCEAYRRAHGIVTPCPYPVHVADSRRK